MEMFILAVCLSADPIVAPWDEPRVKSLEDRVAALEAKIGLCPCITNSNKLTAPPEANQTHPYLFNVGDSINRPTGPAAAQYYAALGSQQYVQSCANGTCQMVPAQSFAGPHDGFLR
jgi:hypothetical protein